MRALRRKAWAGLTKAVRLHEKGALGSTACRIPQLNNVACNVNSTTRCHSMWTYFAGSQCKLVATPARRCRRTNTTSAACIPATPALLCMSDLSASRYAVFSSQLEASARCLKGNQICCSRSGKAWGGRETQGAQPS